MCFIALTEVSCISECNNMFVFVYNKFLFLATGKKMKFHFYALNAWWYAKMLHDLMLLVSSNMDFCL